MAPFLILSLLGFDGFPKLIHPRTTPHLFYIWVWPLYMVHLPGWGSLHLWAFSFQKRDR